MSVALLEETPLAPSAALGPYRREDYDRLPDQPRCELIYGRIFMTPSPTPRHQVIALEIWQRLRDFASHQGGIAFAAPLDVELADHSVVQPDVLYLSAERRERIGEKRVIEAPDLLVEVLSPGTARRDRGDKLRLYAESGVLEYWIVDPAERQIEFLVAEQLGEGARFVVAVPAGPVYRSRAAAGFELDLEELWGEVGRLLPEQPSR